MRLLTRFVLLIQLLVAHSSLQATEWSAQEKQILASLQLSNLDIKPVSPSNRFANNAQAAALGQRIFFDKRFSLDGSLSCASCHQEERAFTDGLNVAQGVNRTARNTQTVLGAAHATWFYWDGRKDSLWSQALVPFEAADEMAGSRVKVLRLIGSDPEYRRQYEQLFGTFPQIVYNTKIDSSAGPWGDSSAREKWQLIPTRTRIKINSAYANIGKAVAAYERTLPLAETRFDDFLKVLYSQGEVAANSLLSDDEIAGLKLFLDDSKTHCLRCHNGPLFTNNDFHNIGSGQFLGPDLDFGRYLGIQAVLQDEFNCLGEFSDAEPDDCAAIRFLPRQLHDELQGAYKTPSLRYLNKTAPYFHDGRYNSLTEVINHYANAEKGTSELPELILTKQEKKELIAFLALIYSP